MSDDPIIKRLAKAGIDRERLQTALDVNENWGALVNSFVFLSVCGAVLAEMKATAEESPDSERHPDIGIEPPTRGDLKAAWGQARAWREAFEQAEKERNEARAKVINLQLTLSEARGLEGRRHIIERDEARELAEYWRNFGAVSPQTTPLPWEDDDE